jgi:hypothetical protein
MTNSRSREAAQRFADRRKREDDAPRLVAEIPNLATLKMAIEERRGSVATAESKHLRHVVVDRAPALFILQCGDPSCDGGGYDLTSRIMRELRARRTEFEVDDECTGNVGNARCGRLVKAILTATYR